MSEDTKLSPDDPLAGTIDDPNVQDPYAHLRKTDADEPAADEDAAQVEGPVTHRLFYAPGELAQAEEIRDAHQREGERYELQESPYNEPGQFKLEQLGSGEDLTGQP